MEDPTPFWQRPRNQIIGGVAGAVLLYLVFQIFQGGILAHVGSAFLDGLICLGSLAFWLFLFAQFVLPVRNIRERLQAFERLALYLTGAHGAAIFVENGHIRERRHARQLRGPGVAILDAASGAVFRKKVAYTRPVGPGVIFTRSGEYVNDAGTVDLHRQTQILGPIREHDEPFSPKAESETEESYFIRQRVRGETSGLTREGIEVVPAIITVFKLDADPGEGRTEFGYDSQAVFNAVRSENINTQAAPGEEAHRVAWNKLPGLLAADLWREYLRKYTLRDLFSGVGEGETALQTIVRLMNERMKLPEVDELDEVGRATGRKMNSIEYALVKNRGVRVIAVNLPTLYLDPKVEEQLETQWKASWLQQARRERELIERRRGYAREKGGQNALLEYAHYASYHLSDDPTIVEHAPPEVLRRVLKGSVLMCMRDGQLHQRITGEKDQIVELIDWINGAGNP